MIGQLVSKIAGPRVLVGLIVAAGLAVGSLSYLLLEAKESAGLAQYANRQLQAELESNEEANRMLRRAMQRREDLVSAVLIERDEAIEKVNQTRSNLREALSDDQCANTPHPGAVADSLQHNGTGGSDHEDRDGIHLPTE